MRITRNVLVSYLLTKLALVGKGSDTSGNYGHKGVKGRRGGSAPGGGHAAIGIGSGATKEEQRAAIDQYQEEAAKEKGKLGPLMRKRLIREHARLEKELAVAKKASDDAFDVLDEHNNTEVKVAYKEYEYLEKNGFPFEKAKERYLDSLEGSSKLFDVHVGHLSKVSQIQQELREKGMRVVAAPINQQAHVQMKSKIKTGRDEAQEGLDAFNQLCGTGTLGKRRVPVHRTSDDRSYHLAGHVYLSSKSSKKVMAHEMGHFLEFHDPKVRAKAQAFLDRRTKGEAPVKLADVYPDAGYKDYEITKPDAFQHAYTGKIYSHPSSEVISMGIQHMIEGAASFAERDPDFFDFTIDVLRG